MAPDDERTSGERALDEILTLGRLLAPERLPAAVVRSAAHVGARDVELVLVDHDQKVLLPLADEGAPHSIDGSVAGRSFRQVSVQEVPAPGGRRLWLPLLNGADRLGAVGLTFDAVDDRTRDRARTLAALVSEILVSRSSYGDTLVRAARRRPMTLAAEMQWSLIPPLTVGSEHVVLSGFVQPSYEVGGDLFDYALDGGCAHVAVFDAMGHGLEAAVLASVAVGAYRNARRRARRLPESVDAVEEALAAQFGSGHFVTALVAELDLVSGVLKWIVAGHPAPLLLRGGRVVKQLDALAPNAPLGLGLNAELRVHEEQLEPGDRVVLYSDGVIDAIDAGSGERFGVERPADIVVRADAAGEPVPETMRRLGHAVLEHQGGTPQDDATQVLVEWHGGELDRIAEICVDDAAVRGSP